MPSPHYTGTMDYWDPAVTDGLAKNREVILFNNAGVSSSSGQVPTSVQETFSSRILAPPSKANQTTQETAG
jgi:hypothetical protein